MIKIAIRRNNKTPKSVFINQGLTVKVSIKNKQLQITLSFTRSVIEGSLPPDRIGTTPH